MSFIGAGFYICVFKPTAMIKQNTISLGIAMAIASILVFLVQALVEGGLFLSILIGVVAFAVMIVLPIVYVRKQRRESGGFISFGDAFKVAFFGLAIGGIISSVFSIVYVLYLDPEYADRTILKTLETQQRFMENAVPTDQMEETMRLTEAGMRDSFTPFGFMKTFGYYMVFYLVLSLIFAAFLKNDDPREGSTALDATES